MRNKLNKILKEMIFFESKSYHDASIILIFIEYLYAFIGNKNSFPLE
jgi:hypothetical protein